MLQLFYKWFAKTDYRETMREDFQKAYEAGYRAGMTHDKRMKTASRSPNAKKRQFQLHVQKRDKPANKRATDPLLAKLKDGER